MPDAGRHTEQRGHLRADRAEFVMPAVGRGPGFVGIAASLDGSIVRLGNCPQEGRYVDRLGAGHQRWPGVNSIAIDVPIANGNGLKRLDW